MLYTCTYLYTRTRWRVYVEHNPFTKVTLRGIDEYSVLESLHMYVYSLQAG